MPAFVGPRPDAQPIDQGRWRSDRVYLIGDEVVDDEIYPGTKVDDYPSPPGRFRALVDHVSGILGPRFCEVDQVAVWERIETLE